MPLLALVCLGYLKYTNLLYVLDNCAGSYLGINNILDYLETSVDSSPPVSLPPVITANIWLMALSLSWPLPLLPSLFTVCRISSGQKCDSLDNPRAGSGFFGLTVRSFWVEEVLVEEMLEDMFTYDDN